MKTIKYKGINIGLVLISIFAVWLTFNYFIELSGFAVAIAKMSIGLLVITAIDSWLLGNFNTHDEIKKGNMAFAIVYAALIILVGFAIHSV